ncbi:TonB family protein [Luteimonas sp. R10]|uniref:energy transducer TonB n=1 Tax=Luteimonas sp. R10 TaxID=3108176 RepID=UPI00308BED49|nr:TonB family protein [Luteimonas sp. R10]
MNRPNPTSPPPPPPPPEEPRKSSSPLVWILLLIALIAVGWYFYAQRDTADAPVEPETPIGEPAEIGDGTPPPPASEREAPAAAPEPSTGTTPPATRPADPIERVEPSYPPTALRAQEEGTVLLRVQVDAQGNPTEVDVARSSRSRELDRAARDAVRRWKFSPAMENGQAVASTVEVPIDFRMDRQ